MVRLDSIWHFRRSYTLSCLIILLVSPAQAELLLCPYDVTQDADGIFTRTLSPLRDTIYPDIYAALGRDLPSPREVAGNRALLTIALASLSARVQNAVLTTAGCSVVTDRQSVDVPARTPLVRNGALVFDDPAQPIVNPRDFGLPPNRRTSWLAPLRSLVASLISPAWAAFGAGPQTPILDNFNRTAEDPLSQGGNWSSTSVSGATNTCETDGTVLTATGSTGGSYRATQDYGPDSEAYFAVVLQSTGHALLLRAQDEGTAGWDGYRLYTQSATNIRLQRSDNGTLTTLTNVTQANDDGDGILYRIVGSTHFVSFNDDGAGWTSISSSTTDSTYTGAGRIGLGCGLSNTLDDFGGGTLPSGMKGIPLWFR